MTSKPVLCTLAVVLAFFVSYGSSLQCYVCTHTHNAENAACEDPFNTSLPFNYTCPSTIKDPLCLKLTGKATDKDGKVKDSVVRGCAAKTKDTCADAKQSLIDFGNKTNTTYSFSYCATCDKDYCNSSVTLTSSFTLYVALFLTYLFVNKVVS